MKYRSQEGYQPSYFNSKAGKVAVAVSLMLSSVFLATESSPNSTPSESNITGSFQTTQCSSGSTSVTINNSQGQQVNQLDCRFIAQAEQYSAPKVNHSSTGYSLTSKTIPKHPFYKIVALGDSITAGATRPLDQSPTNTTRQNLCNESATSYIAMLSAYSGVPATNLACSGAGIYYGILAPQFIDGIAIPPQLKTAKNIINRNTIVILNANSMDTGTEAFQNIMFNCEANPNCRKTTVQGVKRDLNIFKRGFLKELLVIKSKRPRDIIVNLDPLTLPAASNYNFLGINKKDMTFLLRWFHRFNQTTKEIALKNGATTVDISFAGHTLGMGIQPMGPNSWVQGVSGAILHPNILGRRVIACADLLVLGKLGLNSNKNKLANNANSK